MTAPTYIAAAQRHLAELRRRSRRWTVADPVVRAALTAGDWRCERAVRTVTDVVVLVVRDPHGRAGVLKVATTASGAAGLRRERDVLTRLAADERLGGWRTVLPVPLHGGAAGPGAFLLTSQLPGRDGRELPRPAIRRLTPTVVDVITTLHRATATVREVDDELLTRWVDHPLDLVGSVVPRDRALGRLAARLRRDLTGRRLTVAQVHGDLHPGNLLVGPDGTVTGIVDWGAAHDHDLPALDVAFWLLTAREQRQFGAFGGRIADRLDRGHCWTPTEWQLLAGPARDVEDGRTILLLAWLRHVASNLAKSDRYARSPLWLRWNIAPVLRQVAHD